jgi:outer membrane protein assembly factor BamB
MYFNASYEGLPCSIRYSAVIDTATSTLFFTEALSGGLYALNVSSVLETDPSKYLLWRFRASLLPINGAPVFDPSSSILYFGRSSFLNPALLPSSHPFSRSSDNNVYAVYSSGLFAGTQRWNFSTNGSVGTPVIGSGSTPYLFAASQDGFLYALRTVVVGSKGGSLVWSFSAPSKQAFSSPPVLGTGGSVPLVFVGNNDGQLYAVTQKQGILVWNFSTFPAPDGTLQPIAVLAPLLPPFFSSQPLLLFIALSTFCFPLL